MSGKQNEQHDDQDAGLILESSRDSAARNVLCQRSEHQDDSADLEAMIDAFNAELPPLADFVLPGGGAAAASCHMARAICRRAERRVITLAAHEEVNAHSVEYLNRAGIEKLKKRFTRFLDRPDQAVPLYLAGSIFVFFLAPIFMPLALHSLWKAAKMRRDSPRRGAR